MFRKSQQQKEVGNWRHTPQPPEAALQLSTLNSETIYTFPPELVYSLRHMATKLNRDHGLPPKLSLVSALRQEGVSTISLALAAIMAHDLSRRVCLVDLNWWWPSSMMRELATHKPGILPLLYGEVKQEAAIVQTNYPNLTILPAGNLPLTQRPVIARGTALQTLINELSASVDHLILDIPAILTTSDAIPLASLGSACCAIVHQGISPRTAVKQALAEVNHMPTIGVVLNRVQMTTPAWLLKAIPQE